MRTVMSNTCMLTQIHNTSMHEYCMRDAMCVLIAMPKVSITLLYTASALLNQLYGYITQQPDMCMRTLRKQYQTAAFKEHIRRY